MPIRQTLSVRTVAGADCHKNVYFLTAVSEPNVESRARDPKRPMADATGDLFYGFGLSAGRPRVQRDPDRVGFHRRDPRHPRLVGSRGTLGEPILATDARDHRLWHHINGNRHAARV